MGTWDYQNATQFSRKLKLKVMKLSQNLAVLMLLLLLCKKVKSATCPIDVSSISNSSTQLDNFSLNGSPTPSAVSTYNVKVGSVSNALYFMYGLTFSTSSFGTTFVKINSDGSQAWSKFINYQTCSKSLAVDKTEQSVYFIEKPGNPMIVGRLNTTDGSLIDSQNHQSFFVNDNTKVHVLSDNSGYYVIQKYTPDSTIHVIKYLFSSSPPTNQHYRLNGMVDSVADSLMINDTELFCITETKNFNSYDLMFIEFTYTNAPTSNWANILRCSNYCMLGTSESLISTDKSKIYTLFGHDKSHWYVSLTVFNSSNGSIVGNKYESNLLSGCSAASGLVLNNNNLVSTLDCNNILFIYNITSDLITLKSFIGNLHNCELESWTDRLLVVGSKSSSGYVARFSIESLGLMTDFVTETSISFGIASDSYSTTTVYFTSYSNAITPASIPVSDATYIPGTPNIIDVHILKNNQTLVSQESTSNTKTPDLTCSTGSTSIRYSFDYSNNQPPSWVTINQSTGELAMTIPKVTSNTTYALYIYSNVTGLSNPVLKIVYITVMVCEVDLCAICSSYLTCSVCNSGYNLTSSGTCEIPVTAASGLAKSLTTTTQSVSVLSALFSSILSLFNLRTMSSIWSMLNQTQLFYMLLLNRVFIPIDVMTLITGSDIMSNPSSFIQFQETSFYLSLIKKYDSNCTNSILKTFGLKSNSSIFNTGSFFLSFIVLIILHIIVLVLKKIFDFICSCNFCCCLGAIFKWIINKCITIMTYGYYIRFIMQMHQFLLVSSIYEIYSFNLSSVFNIISFIFALLILILCLCYTGVVLFLSLSSYQLNDEGHSKIGEFFNGIKMEKRFKLFAAVFILRRTLFAIFLVCLVSISPNFVILILSLIQFIYLLYIIFTRPYKEVKGNIIEIINEIYFLFLFLQLSILNQNNEWTSSRTSMYSYVITSNSFVMLIIIIIDSIMVLINKLREWLNRPKEAKVFSIQIPMQLIRNTKTNSTASVVPETQSVTQQESEISRNNKYMYEENKINLEDNSSSIKFERRKL